MKLLINPEGGMAGDMFSAALISAGVDFNKLHSAMIAAGEKLGSTQIDLKKNTDGSSQLSIGLESNKQHLEATEAKNILAELFLQFNIEKKYIDFGNKIIDILIRAEKRAHAEFNIVVEHSHSHTHPHSHSHTHHHNHSHPHTHPHPHSDEITFLHEAQDIVIDIMGAVMGLQLLNVEPKAELLAPVSVGGGHIHFSHGTHLVPAPATRIILQEHFIKWKKGPIEKELFTPTGAAILAALGAPLNQCDSIDTLNISYKGKARGTKRLDIPPLEIFIV